MCPRGPLRSPSSCTSTVLGAHSAGPSTPLIVPDNTPLHRDPFLTRRGFLGVVAGTLGASAIAACSKGGDASDTAAAGDTAAATTVPAGNGAPLGLGLQLYTVRDALSKDLDGTLAALAAAGYKHLESAGYAGRSAQEFKAALDKHGLHVASMHVPINMMRDNTAQVLADAKLFGASWVVCPWMDEKERTAEGYTRVGQALAKVADAWKGENVGVAYHNHDFEFKTVEGGKTGFDTLFEAAGPNVKSELDLYWATFAGQDPLAIARANPGRITLAHAKDAGPAPKHEMMDVGRGTIDFGNILTQLKAGGLQYAFVEHDNPKDAVATAKAGLAHLESLKL
jgi:sugar phosphate isomerase/epimerase